ncbi:MAG: glycosyltransferase [Firmicutes bacterium]|nr:glycosyltransferase [Bacillota bacterium]
MQAIIDIFFMKYYNLDKRGSIMLANVITAIGGYYEVSRYLYDFIGAVLGILLAYKAVYFAIGFLFTRKFKAAKNYHKYGILIAARNEENVIGNLLDSIRKQDYPSELLTVFVVADNCTDNTAKIARKHGAVCYERFDNEHKTKGFALQFLFENIKKDYGIENFEGYFIFDADNLLNKNYITKMNDAFDSGEKIITSYRNTKNFDENWIASTYALHWIRSIRTNHRARSVLRLATNIQGTGFLFANEIVRNGWKYTGLTEDRALTADAVARGYQITYQDEAEFFDEQPISLKVALRQRLRWSKGHLLAFLETGPSLFVNIFFGKLFIKDKWGKTDKEEKIYLRIIESIRHRFASFDTLMQLTPIVVINLARWLIVSVFIYACFAYSNGIISKYVISGSSIIIKGIANIFGKPIITIEPGINAFFIAMLLALLARLLYRLGAYFANMWMAIYLFVVEKHRIKKISFLKKVLYTFTWPTFDIIGRYTTYLALFVHVTWKPIPHTSKVTIDEVDTSGGN